MPKRDRAAYMRKYRQRRRVAGPDYVPPTVIEPVAEPPADPAGALAAWAAARLVVPPGHTSEGQPMALPDFAESFFRDALTPGVREAGLFCARKNGKSAILSILLLGHLAVDGPLRRHGFRAGVASLSREKSIEIWQQCEAIGRASDLQDLTFGKMPRVIRSPFGEAVFLSADKSAGHASGFDLAIADEVGLFPVKGGRELVAGLLSSTSAKDGRLIAISILGDSGLPIEMVERQSDPSVAVHLYEAPSDCSLDDETSWHAANPGLGTIKSLDYMRDMSRRALSAPGEQSFFRSHDLNQPGNPTAEMIVSLSQYELCADKRKPERQGPCFVGIDMGGSRSMTAAAAYWPDSGRIDCWGAFGDEPTLDQRGDGDGVGQRYVEMSKRGELRTWPARVVDVSGFIGWIVEQLEDELVELAASDRYRQAETQDALDRSGCAWPIEWRAQGTGKDGSADVRAFQNAIDSKRLRPGDGLLLPSAISQSILRYDGNGNSRPWTKVNPLAVSMRSVHLF